MPPAITLTDLKAGDAVVGENHRRQRFRAGYGRDAITRVDPF